MALSAVTGTVGGVFANSPTYVPNSNPPMFEPTTYTVYINVNNIQVPFSGLSEADAQAWGAVMGASVSIPAPVLPTPAAPAS